MQVSDASKGITTECQTDVDMPKVPGQDRQPPNRFGTSVSHAKVYKQSILQVLICSSAILPLIVRGLVQFSPLQSYIPFTVSVVNTMQIKKAELVKYPKEGS